jgi:hypothetical protein
VTARTTQQERHDRRESVGESSDHSDPLQVRRDGPGMEATGDTEGHLAGTIAVLCKGGRNRMWYPQAALGTRPLSDDGDLEWFAA